MSQEKLRTETRQQQIADAALEIVNTKGIAALNVSAVAEKIGIVPSAVYRHYKSKGDIITAVLDLIRSRLRNNFEAVGQSAADPLEKLHWLLTRHVDLISRNHGIPRIIFSEEVIGGLPDKRRQLLSIIQGVLDQVSAIIRDGQQSGRLRSDIPAENLAVAFLGIIQPAAVIWNLNEGQFDLRQHADNAWKLYSRGILNE
jgi:AcrR family transcriptional regulator